MIEYPIPHNIDFTPAKVNPLTRGLAMFALIKAVAVRSKKARGQANPSSPPTYSLLAASR